MHAFNESLEQVQPHLPVTGALGNVEEVLKEVVLFPLKQVPTIGVDILSDGLVCVEAADVHFTYLQGQAASLSACAASFRLTRSP